MALWTCAFSLSCCRRDFQRVIITAAPEMKITEKGKMGWWIAPRLWQSFCDIPSHLLGHQTILSEISSLPQLTYSRQLLQDMHWPRVCLASTVCRAVPESAGSAVAYMSKEGEILAFGMPCISGMVDSYTSPLLTLSSKRENIQLSLIHGKFKLLLRIP